MGRLVYAAGVGLAAWLLTDIAHADPTEADVTTAQALFDDAKRLMGAGKYAEACPKLVESQRLDPGGGTLIALGLCHEAEGKVASAWADFNLAVSAAKKDGRADREKTAIDHVHTLEPRVPRVRVVVAAPAPGLVVKRDGEAVGDAQWGTPVPIDPGPHDFDATAPGKSAWHATVTLQEATTLDVNVPALAAAPMTATPVPAPSSATPVAPPTNEPPPATAEHHSNGLRTAGFITGGVALVSIGVGTAFAISAKSKWNDASTACPGGKCTDPRAVTEGSDAGKAADIATAFFVIGGVTAAAAVTFFLWPSSSSDDTSKAAIRVTPSVGAFDGLIVQGAL